MNKPALKRFATEARRELLERIELQARKIGITSEGIQKATIESSDAIFIDGNQLSEKERVQRNKLITRISDIGFDRVMEETAYTWFNRFTALRFMEVNDYLPTRVRVLSSINAENTEPDMMKEALSLELNLDKEYIYDLKLNNKDEELFKYLIIKHCNDLNRYMPFMFETIDDYTEILFPEGLLATDSLVRKMTNIEAIPESNWRKIEVIGWLYQYYIAEEKDRVFNAKKKYKAEEIPFATQLFTPDWIVQYMVQNSLGRYWVEAHPEHHDLVNNWEFFLQNTEEGFEEKIAPYVNKELKVEDIKCFDPAMGSGHILVYMFDMLYEIYSKSGYMEREIPRLIIENNLYGLDIDDRAYQLASFSIVMKAMEYNKRFLRSIEREALTINLASIQESNSLTKEEIEFMADSNSKNFEETRTFIKQFQDAKTIGSLIKLANSDVIHLQRRLEIIKTTPITDLFEIDKREKALSFLPKLIRQAQIMSLKFDVLVTNPPYMGTASMNKELADFLKKNYPNSKADLFAAFMEIDHYLKTDSFYASINQHSWMFLNSFEKLRETIIKSKRIENMLHLGPRAFEEVSGEIVQSTTFILRNRILFNSQGLYMRLINEKSSNSKKEKAKALIKEANSSEIFSFFQDDFKKISGSPIAYWVSENIISTFSNPKIGEVLFPKTGVTTGNNDIFLKFWFEVNNQDIGTKWFYLNKGGSFRNWYGNNEYVIEWENNGEKIKRFPGSTVRNENYYFKEGVTWSKISSGNLSARYSPPTNMFDAVGLTCFTKGDISFQYLLGLLCSVVATNIVKILNPTLSYTVGTIGGIPLIYSNLHASNIDLLVNQNINIAKKDWDSYEISWGFKKHPLLEYRQNSSLINDSLQDWKAHTKFQFNKLKENEQKLNSIFLEIYNLNEELSSEVDDKYIAIRKVTSSSEMRSLISYAVGNFFGRFSLDVDGIVYAGDSFNLSNYKSISVDHDNIIPILSGAYFEDDIVNKFVHFVRVTYGEEMLEVNLNFIADAIGRNKNETAREALRRYFLNDFYKDHLQVYKKRPIYWLFTSGKEKAFNCLIYMHRYDKTTLSRIRTDYLHEVQIRMDAEKRDLLNIIEGDSTAKEISDARKVLKSLDKKIDEMRIYDEKLHHMADMQIEIDLDDGVAVNYAKFEGLVAKI